MRKSSRNLGYIRIMTRHSQSLIDFVTDVNRSGGTYHRLDFGDGLVMDGEYAMDQYWQCYGFPEDLTGLSVLDVGTASGYFAVECARRGAQVTTIDIGLCGSLLLHVWDQVGALKRLRAVCRGLTIVATGIMPHERGCDAFPAGELVGVKAMGGNGEYWTTWMPNGLALERMMLAAGFAQVANKGSFRLRSAP